MMSSCPRSRVTGGSSALEMIVNAIEPTRSATIAAITMIVPLARQKFRLDAERLMPSISLCTSADEAIRCASSWSSPSSTAGTFHESVEALATNHARFS